MKKNILVIDDSALMRRTISDIINSDDRFCVADVAANGLEGIDLLAKNPSKYCAVMLDINMPKMNGLQFLEQLNKLNIKATVIVVSTLAKEGAKETIRALELGAFDFITKPDSLADVKSDGFKRKILHCLNVVLTQDAEKKSVFKVKKEGQSTEQQPKILNKKSGAIKGKKIVALACSTGGPKALQTVIPMLPANLDAPVLLVQHMPAGFTKSLANRLDELSYLNVKEAEDGEVIQKGWVYIAPGGTQMRLTQGAGGDWISIKIEPARGGLRPCADIMYESLVGNTNYDEVTCVVLTGMGGDGTQGIKQLNDNANIYVIAQNAETCIVYGMPKVIAETGLVNEIVPLQDVASAIVKNVGVQ